MNEKNKKQLKKILFDSSMIVFSVLLALLLNELRNSHNEANQTEKLIENIKREVKANQDFVKKLLPYHQLVGKKIVAAYETDSLEEKFFKQFYFEIFEVAPKGIIQGKLSNIAWIVAKEDKITNRISLQESNALFEAYHQQEVVGKTIERIIVLLTSREIQRKELLAESATVLGTLIFELIGQEEDLNNEYTELLELLE